MSSWKFGLFLMGASLLASISAMADTTVTAPEMVPTHQSTATTTEPGALDLSRFYLGYYGTIQGSKLSQLGTPYQLSASGNPTTQPIYIASDVTGAYMVTPDIGVGTYLEFNETPLLGQGFQMLDVGITTFDKKLVSTHGLTVFANAIFELPTSSYDINRGMMAGLETTPYIRYEVPHSRVAMGAWTELKNYTGSTSGKVVKTYYNPYVSYQLLPMLSVNFGYELEYDHFAGTSGFSVYETDIQPGIIWNITHQVLFNPYIQYFTNNRITLDSAAFGAAIVARVL